MTITCSGLGKRFSHRWVFRGLSYSFHEGQCYAITGPNGSGKSTLARIIAGQLSPSEGMITHTWNGKCIPREYLYRYVAFAAPYLYGVEELTLEETLRVYFNLKNPINNFSTEELLYLLELTEVRKMPVKFFSSGMKQRLKLGLALLANTPLLILDEPTVSLDEQSKKWYEHLRERYTAHRTVIICSHQEEEHACCESRIELEQFTA